MQGEDKAWIEYCDKFYKVYDELNYSSSLQSSIMRASHKLVEKAYDDQTYFGVQSLPHFRSAGRNLNSAVQI